MMTSVTAVKTLPMAPKFSGFDKMKNRAEQNTDYREEQQIRNTRPAENTGECMRGKNERSNDQYVRGHVHR
jgi:hypothetical protein